MAVHVGNDARPRVYPDAPAPEAEWEAAPGADWKASRFPGVTDSSRREFTDERFQGVFPGGNTEDDGYLGTHLSTPSTPMDSASTTCAAMYGNGARTGST